MSTQEQPGSEDMSPQNTVSSLTQVKTIYARAAIILLAVNFAFTGYLTYNMNQIQSELVDTLQGRATSSRAATLSTEPSPESAVGLREKAEASPSND